MGKAIFRFYEELNDYLPPGKIKRDFEVSLEGKKTAREMIEKLGVPTAEVDLLLVNGQSAGLDIVVGDGDRMSVYPVFERLNIEGTSRVREKPLRKLRFIVDNDLEALAELLRTEGLDVVSNRLLSWEQLVQIARKEKRVLLTGKRDFVESEGSSRVILVKTGPAEDQARRLLRELDIGG